MSIVENKLEGKPFEHYEYIVSILAIESLAICSLLNGINGISRGIREKDIRSFEDGVIYLDFGLKSLGFMGNLYSVCSSLGPQKEKQTSI